MVVEGSVVVLIGSSVVLCESRGFWVVGGVSGSVLGGSGWFELVLGGYAQIEVVLHGSKVVLGWL